MDKHVSYVIISYVITLLLVLGYLAWMWLRLKNLEKDEL